VLGEPRANVLAMKIAYLVNQYPKISHVFIRREILAVEKEGNSVVRYGIRRCAEEIINPLDVEEARKTHTLLDAGWLGLLQALVLMSISRFGPFSRAFLLAIRVGVRSDRGPLRHMVYLAEACVLLRWLAREDVQHVHAHFGTNSATVAMLCRELGGPTYSFTVHGPEEFDNAPLLGLRQKIARASFVAAITSYARSQLYRHCDFRQWPKIKLVRCGVDDDFLGPPPLPMPTSRRLVSIGRLCEQKGQLLLIEALARLHREGRRVDLVLIGDGVLRGEIEAAIQRGHLEGSVRILGWADTATVVKTLDDACALLEESTAALSASGLGMGWGFRYLVPYATALAMRGSVENAAAVLSALEGSRRPFRSLDYERTIARAWLVAGQGAVSEAAALLKSAAEAASRNRAFAAEVMCLQTAVQLGDRSCAPRLHELEGSVEGPRAALAARFAAAVRDGDGAQLDSVSEGFETIGDGVAALDAASSAAVAFRRAERRGSALTLPS